eukprot:g14557.t1
MTSTDTQAPADGPSGSGGSEASRPAEGGGAQERVEVLQSGLSFRSGDGDVHETPVSNRFRSNIEIVEKPRQMIVLVATIVGASYLGFAQNDSDPDANTRAATMGVCFLFLVHCFLQCRDSLFARPHPGVWRIVHGIGMLYLFGVAVLLIHPKDEARRLLAIFIPDVEGHKLSSFEAGSLQCKLTASAVLSQLREVWFPAHLIGWWCKMCLFRDWGVCWVLSIGFELLELSMGWLVPQFHECWWDSLIIDLLGANVLGMTLGYYTLRFLETRTFDWNSREGSHRLPRSLRLLSKFSPLGWSKWRWQAFSSFKRTAQVFSMIAATMLLELNAFMVMNALEIPNGSMFNYIRMTVIFFLALLATSEYYEYCSNPACNRLGQNAWLTLAIMQVEILLWIKFFPQPLMNASTPPEIKLPWLATLSLFSLWGLLFVAVSEDSATATAGGGSAAGAGLASGGGGGVASSSASMNSMGSLLDGSGGSVGDGSSVGGGGGEGEGEGEGEKEGGGGSNGAGGSKAADGAAVVAGANGDADDAKPRRRNSLPACRSNRHKAMLVAKWGLVDAVFILSFMPLLYLLLLQFCSPMVLDRWEEDLYFAPRAGSIGAGLASPAPSPSSSGFGDFAPQRSSGSTASARGSGRGRGSSRGGARGRGNGDRGGSSRGAAAGGRGGRTAGERSAASRSSGGGGDFEVQRPAQPARKRARKKKEYFPTKARGGPTALLGQLLIYEQEGSPNPDIESLQTDSQRFCNEPMKPPSGPQASKKDYFAAWRGMKTLLDEHLVKRNAKGGRKHTFSLTPKGRELAGRVVEEYRETFTGFINYDDIHDGGGGGGGDLDFDFDDDDDDSLSSNPFAPPPRTGARGLSAGPARTASSSSSSRSVGGRPAPPPPPSTRGASPVQNPYAALGSRSSAAAVRASAAEARRAKEMNSNTAAAAAAAAARSPLAGSGTRRGRILQERGTERYEKKARLYESGNDVGSPLQAGLEHFGAIRKKSPSPRSKGTDSAATAAPAAGKKAGRGVADGLVGLNDEVMTLKSRPAPLRPVLKPSPPPARLGAISSPGLTPRKTAPKARQSSTARQRASGGSEVPRWAAAPAPAPAASPSPSPSPSSKTPSATVSVSVERTSGSGSGNSSGEAASVAAAAVGDVVDISLSDDEDGGDEGDDGAGEDGMMMVRPPPDRVQLVSSVDSGRQGPASPLSGFSPGGEGDGDGDGDGGGGGGGSAGGSGARAQASGRGGGGGGKEAGTGRAGGDEGVRARGPGDGGVVPLRSPYRSLSRLAGAAAGGGGGGGGSSLSGAMDWRGRGCPGWLQRELDMGTVRETDRMVDVFDLVLIVDCSEKHEQVRAPIHARLQRFLSMQSLSRAGLATVPAGGVGLEMQVAKLQVGDFAWAWRRKRSGARSTVTDAGEQKELLLLDCVVERKKENDFVDSVEGARYKAQKRRMRLSGMTRLIYLLEGDLDGCRKATTGKDMGPTIRTSETKTAAEGFVLKRVGSVQKTADFLLSLSLQLMGNQGAETVREFVDNAARPKVSLQEWNAAMNPSNFEPPTVNMLFAKCLSQDLNLSDGGKQASVKRIGEKMAGKLVSLFAEETARLIDG